MKHEDWNKFREEMEKTYKKKEGRDVFGRREATREDFGRRQATPRQIEDALRGNFPNQLDVYYPTDEDVREKGDDTPQQ